MLAHAVQVLFNRKLNFFKLGGLHKLNGARPAERLGALEEEEARQTVALLLRLGGGEGGESHQGLLRAKRQRPGRRLHQGGHLPRAFEPAVERGLFFDRTRNFLHAQHYSGRRLSPCQLPPNLS